MVRQLTRLLPVLLVVMGLIVLIPATGDCSWDFILLLPLFFWMFLHIKLAWVRGLLAAGMLTVDFLQVLPRLGGTDIPDFSLWWVPPALLAIYAGSLLADAESAVDIHGAE